MTPLHPPDDVFGTINQPIESPSAGSWYHKIKATPYDHSSGRHDEPPRLNSYFDSAAFWRDAHTKSEQTQVTLRDQIYDLQRQNEDLRGKLKELDKGNLQPAPPRKRKRDDLEEVAEFRMGKQTRRKIAGVQNVAKAHEDKSKIKVDELVTPMAHPKGRQYMRLLYDLQQLLLQEKPNPSQLVAVLFQLASTAADTLSASKATFPSWPLSASTKTRTTRKKTNTAVQAQSLSNEDDEALLRIVLRTFIYLLKGLDKLSVDLEGAKMEGQVIYSYVQLFRIILDSLSKLFQAGHDDETQLSLTNTRSSPIQVALYQPCSPFAKEAVKMHVPRLLVTMIATLDTSKAPHVKILEGFLSIILEQVGRTMKEFVFENAMASPTTDVPKINHSSMDGLGDHARTAPEVLAPCLIWVLERLVFLMRRPLVHLGKKFQNSPATDCIQTAAIARNMSSETMRSLQSTLLKNIFDEDAHQFLDTLEEPTDPGLNLSTSTAISKEDNLVDWFKNEVWRIVGWDILREDIAFPWN